MKTNTGEEQMSELFHNPKYYEIAFSYRGILVEVDVFEECFERFSKVSVNSVLELGCGNAPHMEELIKRGYHDEKINIMIIFTEMISNEKGGDDMEERKVPDWFHQMDFAIPGKEENHSAHCGSGCGGACGRYKE